MIKISLTRVETFSQPQLNLEKQEYYAYSVILQTQLKTTDDKKKCLESTNL